MDLPPHLQKLRLEMNNLSREMDDHFMLFGRNASWYRKFGAWKQKMIEFDREASSHLGGRIVYVDQNPRKKEGYGQFN